MANFQHQVDRFFKETEQVHEFVNGAADAVVQTDNGNLKTIRNVLASDWHFVDPIDWVPNSSNTDWQVPRRFVDADGAASFWWSPSATENTPVNLGATPIGDDNWKAWITGASSDYIRKSQDRMMGYTFIGNYLPNPVTLGSEGDYVLDGSGNRWFGARLPYMTDPTTYPNPFDDVNLKPTSNELKNLNIQSIERMKSLMGVTIGTRLKVSSYYGDGKSQPLDFIAVAQGTGVDDGGKYIDCIGFQAMQLFPYDIPTVKMYGAKDEGKLGFDNATAFQNALNYKSAAIIENSTTGYLIGTSINLTNRFGGSTLLCLGHVGISRIGTYVWGNTGDRAIFDLVGSERNNFVGFGIGTATGNTNPSKIGVFCARSKTNKYAQFNMFNNIVINIDIDDSAFGGLGTFGMYNVASEITKYQDIYFIANTPIYIGRTNIASVETYAGELSSITSCSDFEFLGACCLDSNGAVGSPLHTNGVQSIRGYVYTNGRPKNDAAGQDPNASCWRSDGVTTNCDLTIFIEFSYYIMTLGGSFNDNKVRFLGNINKNRYIIKNTDNFIGVNNSKIRFERTVSGAFEKPNYFLNLDTTDSANNIEIEIPFTPNTAVISNSIQNQKQCSFTLEGKKVHSFESVTSYELYSKSRENGATAVWGYIVGSSPEGIKAGNAGSIYSANIAGVGRIFKKESGSGNTGWVEL